MTNSPDRPTQDEPDSPDEQPNRPEQPERPEPPRASLPEPPWFAMREPEPPRGSPEAPPLAAAEYRSPESWSAGLEQLAVAGRERARTSRRRPTRLLVAAVVLVVVAVAAGVTVFLVHGDSSTSAARVPFCDPGTRGDATTIAGGQDPTTPVGAVAAFLKAAVTDRSVAGARATMSTGAVTPSTDELQTWISALPASTDGWCATVTTTESTARLLVDVRIRTADGVGTVARQDSVYVSSPSPDRWTLDAIVGASTS
ncbi:hypothetical protein [Williamsia serinedens]|uniref:DUF8176 domain-containing protein n=1 Tax=Williamsia serinedens TaxID=391736 RepID=A0ABT1H0B2_9NOCA|nr:hypothetical protein [Williamsia serinedens]MCP2159963.1 hypothetical protein [Williamsia serinedens]